MRNIVNPFKGLEKHEQELKRHSLYAEIKQLLIQSEAYDDSAIGHEFVTHFEKELPGIITAHTQDHSFINGDTSTNRRIIMEAVEGGTVLKAGLVAAVLMLVYKIIMVVTNNKSFSKDGAGGGRGSSGATKIQIDELTTAVSEFNANKDKLKEVIPSAANNPLHTEEDSKVYKAASKAIQVFQVNDDGTSTEIKNPVKEVETISFVATTGNLAAFFALKDVKQTAAMLGKVNKLYNVLGKINLNAFVSMMMTVASQASSSDLQHTTKAFNSEGSATMLQNQIKDIATKFEINGQLTTVEDLKDALSEYIYVDSFINRSYNRVLTDNPNEVMSIQELSEDVLNIESSSSKVKRIFDETVKLNEKFVSIIENESELEDSKFYQNLQMFVTVLSEAKEALYREKPEGYDSAAQRISQYIMLQEIFTKNILKIFATFRKQSDTGNTFLDLNIAKLNEANKALTTVINEIKTDEGA